MIILMIVLMLFVPASVLYIRFQNTQRSIAPSVERDAKVARYDRALRVVVANRLSGGNEWL